MEATHMRTGTLVSASRHKVPVPKCSVLNRYKKIDSVLFHVVGKG